MKAQRPKVVQFVISVIYSEGGGTTSYSRDECFQRAADHLLEQMRDTIPEDSQCTVISAHRMEEVQ